MNESSVSANNKFLVAIGVVKTGKKKTITPIGAELAINLDRQFARRDCCQVASRR